MAPGSSITASMWNRLQFYGEVEVGPGNPNIKQNWDVNAGLRWSF